MLSPCLSSVYVCVQVTIHDMINRHPNIVRLLGYSVGELRPARVKPPALEKKPAAATSTATTAQATQQQQQHQAAIPVSRPRANNQSTQGQASASSQAAAAQAAKPQLFIIMELYGGARVRGWRNNENSLYKTVALVSACQLLPGWHDTQHSRVRRPSTPGALTHCAYEYLCMCPCCIITVRSLMSGLVLFPIQLSNLTSK